MVNASGGWNVISAAGRGAGGLQVRFRNSGRRNALTVFVLDAIEYRVDDLFDTVSELWAGT